MPLLEVESLATGYGERDVLFGVSFAVETGDGIAILGVNGAGKTTTLRCLAGLIHPTHGRVLLSGQDISRMPAHEIARLGVALVPEGRQLFPKHTVRENLEMGAYQHLRNRKTALFRQSLVEVFDIFPLIAARLDQPAGQLSGGEQQMVAIARALVSRPRLLLLDEPSFGLAPKLVAEVFEVFSRLKKTGLSILMAEQMTRSALKCCEGAIVLQRGGIVLSGTSAELTSDRRIMDAYLGNPNY